MDTYNPIIMDNVSLCSYVIFISFIENNSLMLDTIPRNDGHMYIYHTIMDNNYHLDMDCLPLKYGLLTT